MPSAPDEAQAGVTTGTTDHSSCNGGKEFRFILSQDISLPLSFRVNRFVPDRTLLIERSAPVLFVECTLYIDGVQFGLSTNTRLKSLGSPYCWNELVTLSAKYRDLTPFSHLAFTVWDMSSGEDNIYIVGGTTISLFNSKNQLKTGRLRLRVWPNKMADGSLSTSTPGKVPKTKREEIERLERVANKYIRGQIPHIGWLDNLIANAADKLEKESERTENLHSSLIVELCSFEHRVVFQEYGAKLHTSVPSSLVDISKNKLVIACDPEIGRINPSEHKHSVLAWSLARGVNDREMKPSSVDRKLIQNILKYPPTRTLNVDEKQLLWKFRFYLTSEKKALVKFLLSVEWSDIQEAKQAVALIPRWESIDVADALGLLSPVFQNEEVRAYAVGMLERASDEELQCYLLQLVQGLRFERSDRSRLAHFLVNRALSNYELASFLRWYLVVELHDPSHARRYLCTYEMLEDAIMRSVHKEENGFQVWQSLIEQAELTAQLRSIMKELSNVKHDAQTKGRILEQLFSGIFSELKNFSEPIPSPLTPTVLLDGIVPEESLVFKSANYPLCIAFSTVNGGTSKMIFKMGDNLRKDQLVIQIISLMDRLLKSDNLDLHLTPYQVLATGLEEGLVEFIPSISVAKIIQKTGSIESYLQKCNPDEDGPFGITAQCLETFIKSCAGYSVITYILGIGDRHLDNLLLQDDGRLFHVDFSYMLGEQPHRFAPPSPPMKLCKEMVEAMGGTESEYYARFKSYCCEAYNILRKSSNLILNLFYLMTGSNIESITDKGTSKLQQNFRLDLDDEDAIHFLQGLINESISAFFPQVVETIHQWAQSRR
ncbi:phosphatidylinositol 3-kinase, root isoform-like [Oryza glaberrima]|uniref:phosphatidylinositol 3-kinase n=1 Tax=Oryza glaberrima TaxID=4538 RepID=I1QHH0_ORYGL|nr:phosphatidylinositol 3-kinase, root isoform-like [Oryza glaberrima]